MVTGSMFTLTISATLARRTEKCHFASLMIAHDAYSAIYANGDLSVGLHPTTLQKDIESFGTSTSVTPVPGPNDVTT